MKANQNISLHLCPCLMQVRKCPSSVFSILLGRKSRNDMMDKTNHHKGCPTHVE
jgi:hypothetical protein